MPESNDVSVAYRGLYRFVNTVATLLTRKHSYGASNLPKQGPALVVANHTSNYDTIALGDFLISNGRWPRFLGKADIWKVPVVRWFAIQARQIPVERHTPRAKDSLVHAEAALANGDLVAIYPEGTITRDDAGWPMKARNGAARLALATGVPVIPVAIYGASALLGGRYLEFHRLFSLRKRDVHVSLGAPVDLSDLPLTDEPADEQLAEATRRIMAAINGLYSDLRGEPVPEKVWDQWQDAYVERS